MTELIAKNERLEAENNRFYAALKQIADRTEIHMLCPTAPSKDAADGFELGARKATEECAEIANAAIRGD